MEKVFNYLLKSILLLHSYTCLFKLENKEYLMDNSLDMKSLINVKYSLFEYISWDFLTGTLFYWLIRKQFVFQESIKNVCFLNYSIILKFCRIVIYT